MRNVLKGISFDGTHTYDDLGLYMADYPEIEMPEVQDKWVEVPGRDGKLNLTTALDGYPHYYNRDCEFQFLCIGSKADGMSAYSRLANKLHGQKISRIVFDEDPGYYYTGQLEVSGIKYKDYRSVITVEGSLNPFKYEYYEARYDDWYWDRLDFEGGYIRDSNDYSVTVENTGTTVSTKTVTIGMAGVNTVPQPLTIYVYTEAGSFGWAINDDTQYTKYTSYHSETIVIPSVMIDDTNNTVTLNAYGTGTIGVVYRGHRL